MITGKQAWGILAAAVILYELTCKPGELLSEATDDWIRQRPILWRLPFVFTALHVSNLIPPVIDPIHLGFVALKKLHEYFRK